MPSAHQIQHGGRPHYNAATRMIAFDRRDPTTGWFETYICRRDGSAEINLTHNLDFWTGDGAPAGTQRHVGLPRWSPDGKWLLLSVERWLSNQPSNNVTNHQSAAPGRGIANDVWILNLRDRATITRVFRFDTTMNATVGIGSMHANFNHAQTQLAVSRTIDATGQYANWDIGIFNMFLPPSVVTPIRGAITRISPCNVNNPGVPHMTEVNSWDIDDSQLFCAGNPVSGQVEGTMDIFSTSLDGLTVNRYSFSAGVNGEGGKYQEHIVRSPHGSKIAWMGNDYNPIGSLANGTELYWMTWANGTNAANPRHQLSHFNVVGHPDNTIAPPINQSTQTTARPDWLDESTLIVDAHQYPNTDTLNSDQGAIVLFEGVDRPSRYYSSARVIKARSAVNRRSKARIAVSS